MLELLKRPWIDTPKIQMSNPGLQQRTSSIKIREMPETRNLKIRAKVSQKVRLFKDPKVMEEDHSQVKFRLIKMMETQSKKLEGQM